MRILAYVHARTQVGEFHDSWVKSPTWECLTTGFSGNQNDCNAGIGVQFKETCFLKFDMQYQIKSSETTS